MLRNISYKDKELAQEIDQLVGSAYGLIKILKMKGIGSPRMQIVDASPKMLQFINKIGKGEFCNIEIRPKGMILRFRYNLDSMAWIIPFYKLSIFSSGNEYSLHADGNFIKVIGANGSVQLDSFFRKLQSIKANSDH